MIQKSYWVSTQKLLIPVFKSSTTKNDISISISEIGNRDVSLFSQYAKILFVRFFLRSRVSLFINSIRKKYDISEITVLHYQLNLLFYSEYETGNLHQPAL